MCILRVLSENTPEKIGQERAGTEWTVVKSKIRLCIQCRMMINGIQFIQALLEANGLAAGKDHQFKGRYDAEKNAVIISLKNGE